MTPTTPREALEKADKEDGLVTVEQSFDGLGGVDVSHTVDYDAILTALAPWLEWETIDKAPKDQLVWVWSQARGRQLAEFYPSGKWMSHAGGYDLEPTHFMLLPQPPKVTHEKA